MIGLIRAELLKIQRRRMAWILTGLIVVLIGAIYAALFATVGFTETAESTLAENLAVELRFDHAVAYGDTLATRVVALLAIILAASMTASEFGWRTVVSSTMWTGQRARLVIAKAAALGIIAAIGLVIGFATVLAGDLVGSVFVLEEPGRAAATLPYDLVAAIVRSWIIVMVYVSAAVTVAYLTKSSAAGVAIPLVILLLEPLGTLVLMELGGPAANLAEFTLSRNIDGVLAANGVIEGSASAAEEYPSAWRGAAFLASFSAISLWIAARQFSRRDITE